MYVSYTGCGIQQVAPETMAEYAQQSQQAAQLAARQSVGLGCAGCGCADRGLGDYLQDFHFPIPQYLTPGNPRGLGDFSMTAPGGYFSTLDFTQWGFGEWGTVIGGMWVLYSVFHTTGQAVRYAAGTRSRHRKRKAEGYRKLAAEYSKK